MEGGLVPGDERDEGDERARGDRHGRGEGTAPRNTAIVAARPAWIHCSTRGTRRPRSCIHASTPAAAR
jgi:hypothetical protein